MAGLSFDTQEGVSNKEANAAFKKGLNKIYGWYTGGFMAFVVVPLSYAFAGHPGAASPAALAVVTSVVHILAIGTWFGGLVVLATSTQLREPMAVKWFSQRAAALVGIERATPARPAA